MALDQGIEHLSVHLDHLPHWPKPVLLRGSCSHDLSFSCAPVPRSFPQLFEHETNKALHDPFTKERHLRHERRSVFTSAKESLNAVATDSQLLRRPLKPLKSFQESETRTALRPRRNILASPERSCAACEASSPRSECLGASKAFGKI